MPAFVSSQHHKIHFEPEKHMVEPPPCSGVQMLTLNCHHSHNDKWSKENKYVGCHLSENVKNF